MAESIWRASFRIDRKSTRLNSSHLVISYAVFCLKKNSASKEENDMKTFLLSSLLLFTLVGAFASGVAMEYWVICGLLNLFHPDRTHFFQSSAPARALPFFPDQPSSD